VVGEKGKEKEPLKGMVAWDLFDYTKLSRMVIYHCAAVAIFCTTRRERSYRFGFIIRNDDAENYGEEDQPLKQTRCVKRF
jgi:hypothetical protein